MKINFNLATFLLASIVSTGLVLTPLSSIKADSGVLLYVTPSSNSYDVNDLIKVSVKINTKGETINAVKAALTFNENLEVKSVSKSGSILTLWAPGEEPSYSNSSRKITFGGAGAGTTYKGSAGKLISITLKAKKAGTGTISFCSHSVKYGATAINVDSTIGGSYAIVSCDCGSWQDKACGGGSCLSSQRFQTRTCTPSKCALDSRCVADSSCVSAPLAEAKDEEEEEEIVAAEDEAEDEAAEAATEADEEAGEEEIVQKGLLASLAMVWGGTKQAAIIIMIGIFSVISLAFLANKEWGLSQRLFQNKK